VNGWPFVRLLDAREHLLVDRFAERLERLRHLRGVLVLRVEVSDDFGVALLAQPEVIVHATIAELDGGLRLFRGEGRLTLGRTVAGVDGKGI